MLPLRNVPDLSGVNIPGRLLPYYYFNSTRHEAMLAKKGVEIFWGDNLQYGPKIRDSFWHHFDEPPRFDNPEGLFVRLTKRNGEHPLIMFWHSPPLVFRRDALPIIEKETSEDCRFFPLKLIYRNKIVFVNEYHLLGFPYFPPLVKLPHLTPPPGSKTIPAIRPGALYLEIPGEQYFKIQPLHRFVKELGKNPPILYTDFGTTCLSERLVQKLVEIDPDLQFDPTYLPYEYMESGES